MRLNNRAKIPLYNFINSVLMVLVLVGIGGFIVERYTFQIFGWESYLLLLVPIFAVIIFYIRGRQIFEYDSDGEALNFKNRAIVPFMEKPASDEFPKYKLLKYEIVDAFIFKRLYITISSKKNHTTTLKYDVSYLSNKELKDLKFSLAKVIKANKEEKREG